MTMDRIQQLGLLPHLERLDFQAVEQVTTSEMLQPMIGKKQAASALRKVAVQVGPISES